MVRYSELIKMLIQNQLTLVLNESQESPETIQNVKDLIMFLGVVLQFTDEFNYTSMLVLQ